MGFDDNFRSLVQLKKDKLGLDADQQQFDQAETFFRRDGELKAQRLGNERSQFELDRSKGFMPIEMQNARVGLQSSMNSMTNQQDQADFSKRMNQFDIQNRATEQIRGESDYNYQAGRQRVSDSRQDSDYNYQAGRRGLMDARGDTEYELNKARSSGYGNPSYRPPQLDQGPPAIQSSSRYADGGRIQNVATKGFSPVPVRVSNGEYELTPEQVESIGFALLASKNQPAPVGLGNMQ